ncbi:MAG: dienelactone hydrolase family protein [Sphingopyxis sp.]
MCKDITGRDIDRVGLPVGRRSFAALAGAGALMAALPTRAALSKPVKGRDVTINTDDGACDAYFVAPVEGKHPGVLIWPDIRSLRPTFRQMADRLAGEGYAVLCVNPYYRWETEATTVASNMNDAAVRDRLRSYLQRLNKTLVETDAAAHVRFLDGQSEVDTTRRIATTGYCMGGPMTIYTAALRPDRTGAAASFHGARVGTGDADSPHLLIPRTNAGYLFAIAEDDDRETPNEKDLLKSILAPHEHWNEVEVYPALHSWCIPDSRAYDEARAEKAWSRQLALFKASL